MTRPPAPDLVQHGSVAIVGTKAERRAARERVSAYHQAQLAQLLSHVAAAIDRYCAGEIDAYDMDETIHHYHRAAGELWKFCFSRGEGSHAEFTAGLLEDMAAGAETIDWWDAPHRGGAREHNPCPPGLRSRAGQDCHRRWPRLSAQSRRYGRLRTSSR